MFAHRDTRNGRVTVEVAFTGAATTLEEFGDTDPEDLGARLAALDAACGVPVARMRQVHGARVQVLEDPDPPARSPEVDGLVTARPGLGLLARAADCVPLLLADPGSGVIGAVHCGRPGLAAGIVPETLAAMRELGATATTAWIGPHICGRCYEVPEELRAEVSGQVPEAHAATSWGTPSLDIGAGVLAQLRESGCDEVLTVGGCTREDPRWHSFRRDGDAAGRFGGVIWIAP